MQGRTSSFSLSSVHPGEVDIIIASLSNSSSFGLDMIDTYIIKLIKPEILPALTHIINLSISTRKFPDFWKKVKVIPLYKKEDLLNPKNYRPVAIVPIFSKVLERVIFNQMIQYLNNNKLIHPNHHAYRANHNTTTALLQMYDVWLESLGNGEVAALCFLDMSAAFDIVDHTLLISKLDLYGFDSGTQAWISSYLENRYQCVSIDGCLSKLRLVQHGVPQGSILGPLLYIIFTNELPEVIHSDCTGADRMGEQIWPDYTMVCSTCGCIGCYADDTTYSFSGTDPAVLSEHVTAKYQVLSDFLVSNKLKLNDDKTHLMVMSTSQARLSRERKGNTDKVVIKTPIKDIEPSETEKLLGCWLHQDMKWGEHLQDNDESLIRSLNCRVGALKMICRVANFKTRKMIADGIFMSKMTYLIALWGGSADQLMNPLQKAQNKAARAVTKLDWNTPVRILLQQCGSLSVHQLAVYHSVVMVYKVMQTESPKYLFSMFSTKYNCDTRHARRALIRPTRDCDLELSEESFRWRAARAFNALPFSVRESSSMNTFKIEVKKWVKMNIPLD